MTGVIRTKSNIPHVSRASSRKRPGGPVLSGGDGLVRKMNDTEVSADAGARDDDFTRRELAVLARANTTRDFAGDGTAVALDHGLECGVESGGSR